MEKANGIRFSSETVLINGYESSDLISIINEFKLTDDKRQLLILKLVLFIGLNENGKRSEKIMKENIIHVSQKIGHLAVD